MFFKRLYDCACKRRCAHNESIVCDLRGGRKLTVDSLLIRCNTCSNEYNQLAPVLWPILVMVGAVAHSICGAPRPSLGVLLCPTSPCCFPVEWNNLPPSGEPVWVRGPAFGPLLFVCSEEEAENTIRHRWLSSPGRVLIPSPGRAGPAHKDHLIYLSQTVWSPVCRNTWSVRPSPLKETILQPS